MHAADKEKQGPSLLTLRNGELQNYYSPLGKAFPEGDK